MTFSNRLIHVPTVEKLRQSTGGRSFTSMLLERECSDVIRWRDDFLGDLIRGDATSPGAYEVVTGVDGLVGIEADSPGGVADLDPGNGAAGASGEYVGLSLPELGFTGDYSCAFMARLKLDNVATVKLEMGWTDVTTDAGVVNALATPTATATNAAVWVMDTDDDAYMQCFGVKDGTVATKIEEGSDYSILTLVNDTYVYPIVALEGNTARFYMLNAAGQLLYASDYMADAIEGGTQVCPWIFIQLRAAVERHCYIDLIDVWGRRAT